MLDGHVKDLEYLSQSDKYTKWNVIGYLDDNTKIDGVIGPVSDLLSLQNKYNNLHYSIAINSSKIRKKIDNELDNPPNAANLIHETAVIGTMCSYMDGLTLGPYCVLTTRISIGRHVHINTSATINQASEIGDYCTLSPGAIICGDVKIGSTTSIGAGAVVINYKTIGADATLGAGTVVIDNVDSGATVVGVPGREIKKIQDYI